MSRRSFLAAGAQTGRLFSAGMFVVELADQRFDIELLAQARIELADADLDGRAQLVELLDALEQFTAQLLLRGLRQGGRLGHRQLQRLGHGHQEYHNIVPRGITVLERDYVPDSETSSLQRSNSSSPYNGAAIW